MKLLLIQPYINKDRVLVASGSSIVAVDSVGAGTGECVLFHARQLRPADGGHQGRPDRRGDRRHR